MRRSYAPSAQNGIHSSSKPISNFKKLKPLGDSNENYNSNNNKSQFSNGSSNVSLLQKTTQLSTQTSTNTTGSMTCGTGRKIVFSCVWRKKQYKKHKTWDGDGTIVATSEHLKLYDMDGKDLGSIKNSIGLAALKEGLEFDFGSRDAELGYLIEGALPSSASSSSSASILSGIQNRNINMNNNRDDDDHDDGQSRRTSMRDNTMGSNISLGTKPSSRNFISRSVHLNSSNSSQISSATTSLSNGRTPSSILGKPMGSDGLLKTLKNKSLPRPFSSSFVLKPNSSDNTSSPFSSTTATTKSNQAKSSFNQHHSRFQTPTLSTQPSASSMILMKRPEPNQFNPDEQIFDVRVDQILAKHLRPHQIEGVEFLYECVMGLREFDGQGAILADEMGLGKTLQAITLTWILLKQNPYSHFKPVVNRALVLCPATLVKNWKKEFKKWLGDERVRVFTLDEKANIHDFVMGKVYHVMICGYEKMRRLQEVFQVAQFGLVICDEGHRLKNNQIAISMAVQSLPTKRRVILTGTPIQNDLTEFFAMCDFVNPSLLGTLSEFKKRYASVIDKSREPGCSAYLIEKGHERLQELTDLTSQFILRRTSEINQKYLPPKEEIVLFCPLTQVQKDVYQHVIDNIEWGRDGGTTTQVLVSLTRLKKLCNSPQLVKNDVLQDDSSDHLISLMSIPDLEEECKMNVSGKLHLLSKMLFYLKTNTQDKLVIVSSWTETLDLIQTHSEQMAYSFLRLDGKTPVAKRQEYVDRFNRTSSEETFLFLLSSRAGGVGLNLVGANRLVLFDIDWNPSICQQAMARVWRTGTIEERIYQRQLTKLSLSASIIDEKDTINTFTKKELKDLFSADFETCCLTHDICGCGCDILDASSHLPSDSYENSDINDVDDKETSLLEKSTVPGGDGREQNESDAWKHYHPEKLVEDGNHIQDSIVRLLKDDVSFIYYKYYRSST